MGKKLPREEAELYRRCDEVLHYIWDPIGVAGTPGARDEYYSYLPKVYELIQDEADTRKRIEDYLVTVERTSMGLGGNRKHARAVVKSLMEWRDWIEEYDAK